MHGPLNVKFNKNTLDPKIKFVPLWWLLLLRFRTALSYGFRKSSRIFRGIFECYEDSSVTIPCSYAKQVIGHRLPTYHWILNNRRSQYSVYNYTATRSVVKREKGI